MKTRVSLSIKEDLLRRVDALVDGIFIRSRSDAVEKILEKHFRERKVVVILAGGDPERLRIRGTHVYRPLAILNGRRLVEDIILKCKQAGLLNFIVIGFASLVGKIYEVVKDGKDYGVRITYIEEKKELGSAKTLELAKDYLKDDFLFLPCDHWFDFDLRKLREFHLQQKGVATLAIHTRTTFDWKTSIVSLDGYRIVEYEEYPKKPKTRLVSIFIGYASPEILDYIPPGEVRWSLQENVFPKLAKEGKLIGYPVTGNWINVHTKEDLERVLQLSKG